MGACLVSLGLLGPQGLEVWRIGFVAFVRCTPEIQIAQSRGNLQTLGPHVSSICVLGCLGVGLGGFELRASGQRKLCESEWFRT